MNDLLQPAMTWLEQYSALQFVLTLLAIYFVLRTAWVTARRTLPGVKKGIQFLEALATLPVFMNEAKSQLCAQAKTLEEVRHEVLPNNGGSMRDELRTIGIRVEKVEARQDKDYHRMKELEVHLEERRQLHERKTQGGSDHELEK